MRTYLGIWCKSIVCRQKGAKIMTNEERFQKYIDENCPTCKNKSKDLCDIRISYLNGIVTTKCSFYEREKR